MLFPTIKSESFGQSVYTLISEYYNGNIKVSQEFINNYHDSLVVIDEIQKL